MKYIFILLLLPSLAFSQSSHYDSLYAKGLINKSDWMILQQTYKPTDADVEKIKKYDSLYAKGAINKAEYDALKSSISPHLAYDTLQERLDHYDSLFRDRKLTIKEHQTLVDEAKEKYKTPFVPTMASFDPKVARATASRQTNAGVAMMVLSDILAAVSIGRGVAYAPHTTDGANVVAITFCVAFRIVGIGLFGHTATLRRRAERYEANQMFIQK